jgi:hypothetical protein
MEVGIKAHGASGGGPIKALDASVVTTGVFSIERIPAASLERMVTVANETERFALTVDAVQEGDTVFQSDIELMFKVIDAASLNSEGGYQAYKGSVFWDAIQGKPVIITEIDAGYTIAGGGIDQKTLTVDETKALSDKMDKLKALFSAANTVTVSSGAIAVTQSLHIVDSSEDLNTISGGENNQVLLIRAADTASFTVKHGIGNILTGGSDIVLDNVEKYLFFIYDPAQSKWVVVGGTGLTPEQELILLAHASRHYTGNDDELFNQSLNNFDDVKFKSIEIGNPVDTLSVEYPIFELKDINGDGVTKVVAEFDDLTDGAQNGSLKFYIMRSGVITNALELGPLLVKTIRIPTPTAPTDGEANVPLLPALAASTYGHLYGITRDYRQFQIDFLTGDFSTPIYDESENSDTHTVTISLTGSTAYLWRCRDVSIEGDIGEWSAAFSFQTAEN